VFYILLIGRRSVKGHFLRGNKSREWSYIPIGMATCKVGLLWSMGAIWQDADLDAAGVS